MIDFSTVLQSPYYYFNTSSLVPFLFCNLAVFLSLFVFLTNIPSSLHRSISYFYASCALWLLAYALTLNAWVDPVTFFWGRVTYLGIILVPATLLHISLVITEQYKRKRLFLWFIYFGVFILFLQMWMDPFFVGIKEYPWGFSPKAKDAQIIFILFSIICFVYAFLNIMRHYLNFLKHPQRRDADLAYRRKLEFVMGTFVITALSNITTFNNYGISIYPWEVILLFLAMVTMAYVLIKYHKVEFLEELREVKGEVKFRGKQVENARLKLADMGKASIFASLSAGILHQMCQPVTAIHGLTKFMRNNMDPKDNYYKTIDLILEQSTYMKEMINDLMNIIRHKEVKLENVNVNVCIERALRLLKDELRIKRINWDFTPQEDIPFVFADEVHLQQTFMNIVVNGMDALNILPKGEKRYIKIYSEFNPSTNHVFIFFQNTGTSLSPKDIDRIFEPFVTSREAGTGIGLALCKDLILEHGGDVTVENMGKADGGGVRFCVKIPASPG